MANNITVTQGSGTTVATDQGPSGEHYQLVKLVDSTEDSTTRTGLASNPLQVSLANTGANATAVKVDNSAVTQPVSAVSLPLPTGAATSANQTTIIGHVDQIEGYVDGIETSLTSIDGKITACNTGAVTVASSALPTGAATSALQTTGNSSLSTIAGAVTGTEMQVDVVTMPTTTVQATNLDIRDLTSVSDSVSAVQSGTWNIGTVTAVTGITNALPAGTNTIGKLGANSGVDIGDVDVTSCALPTGASTAANQTSGGQKTQIVDGTGNVIGATSNALDVNIKSGGAGDGAILDGVSSAIKATVKDLTNSNPLTVAVTDANGDQITSFGGGTQYTEGDTDASITGTAMMFEVDTGTNTLGVVNDSNPLPMNIVSANPITIEDGGGAITVDGTVAATQSGTWNVTNVSGTVSLPTGASTAANQTTIIGHLDGVEGLLTTIDADTSALAGAVSGTEVQVDVLTMPTTTVQATNLDIRDLSSASDSVTVTGTVGISAGTANIGDVDILSIAAGDNNIGNVDLASAIPAGTNNIGDVDVASIAAGDNNIGNVDLASAIPAGTNAIGKLLPPDIDVTAHTNYIKKYYTNAGAVTDGIVWSPAAGKRWHVVSMHINSSAAATVTLEDDKAGGDDPVWKMEMAANSGETINFSEMYPLASGEDAADLIVTTSAGNIYITVTGYEI